MARSDCASFVLGSRTVKVSMRPNPAWPIKTVGPPPYLTVGTLWRGHLPEPCSIPALAGLRFCLPILNARY